MFLDMFKIGRFICFCLGTVVLCSRIATRVLRPSATTAMLRFDLCMLDNSVCILAVVSMRLYLCSIHSVLMMLLPPLLQRLLAIILYQGTANGPEPPGRAFLKLV